MTERRGPEHMSPAASAEASHHSRLRESTKKWLRWGFDLAAIGGGLLLAAHFLVPVIPFHATTKIALANLGNLLGKIFLVGGGVTGAVGIGKAVADNVAPNVGH